MADFSADDILKSHDLDGLIALQVKGKIHHVMQRQLDSGTVFSNKNGARLFPYQALLLLLLLLSSTSTLSHCAPTLLLPDGGLVRSSV